MDKSWNDLMNGKYKFNPIEVNKLARKNGHEFPLDKDTFRFTKYPIEHIKCVIVGIEPYSTYFTDENGNIVPQATGRSFEAKELENKKWTDKFKQASLRNIGKCIMLCKTEKIVNADEFRKSIFDNNFQIADPTDWFDNLEKQGVCFLNAALTVKKDVPYSGNEYWNGFAEAFISAVTEKNKNITWFLFGKDAQNIFLPFLENQKIICTPHPRMAEFCKTPWFNECKDIDWTGLKDL